MSDDLCLKLRSREVLHRSWAAVKASGLSSPSEATVKAINNFDDSWVAKLERLHKRLREGKFAFVGERGVTVPKSKGQVGYRPLVVAPIENRIVRRAILEVLQGYGNENSASRKRWAGISAVRAIMDTRTSVGGIRERGVPHGLSLIDEAIRAGKPWFVRSDIKSFFTRIPLDAVKTFMAHAIPDQRFVGMFEAALATNLENQEELAERHHHILFPSAEVGVAQGSALSALAGNIALRDFDRLMNDRDIVCVRYIDDFILLGPTQSKVIAAYRSARTILSQMGMDVYDLTDQKARTEGKVDDGNIYNGTDVLGYRVSGLSRQPSAKAISAFLGKLDKVVAEAKQEMRLAAKGQPASHLHRYHQSMVMLHKITWGWSQSFRHTTAQHVFAKLDVDVTRRIKDLQATAQALTQGTMPDVERRVMGVHVLSDTMPHPLPAVSKIRLASSSH